MAFYWHPLTAAWQQQQHHLLGLMSFNENIKTKTKAYKSRNIFFVSFFVLSLNEKIFDSLFAVDHVYFMITIALLFFVFQFIFAVIILSCVLAPSFLP